MPAVTKSQVRTRLVYGATGRAGLLVVETPSRGTLRPEKTLNNIQRGSASYVAEALVQLASDEKRTWERQALFFNYGA